MNRNPVSMQLVVNEDNKDSSLLLLNYKSLLFSSQESVPLISGGNCSACNHFAHQLLLINFLGVTQKV